MRLTLYAPEADVTHTATADTFAGAAVELLKDLLATYEDIIPAVFEGLAELADAALDGESTKFSHSDFSMPEENFTLEAEL